MNPTNELVNRAMEPKPSMSTEMRDWLYETTHTQIERLFERQDIQRDGDEIHDLRKLVLSLATEMSYYIEDLKAEKAKARILRAKLKEQGK